MARVYADVVLYNLRKALDRIRDMNESGADIDSAEAIITLIQVADHALSLDCLLSNGGSLPDAWHR